MKNGAYIVKGKINLFDTACNQLDVTKEVIAL
jgi:hypothetical protein